MELGDTPPACGHSSPFDRQSSTVPPFLLAARCQEEFWQLAKERARQHVSNNDAVPSATRSYDPLPARVPPAVPPHPAATTNTAGTSGPRTGSELALSVAT